MRALVVLCVFSLVVASMPVLAMEACTDVQVYARYPQTLSDSETPYLVGFGRGSDAEQSEQKCNHADEGVSGSPQKILYLDPTTAVSAKYVGLPVSTPITTDADGFPVTWSGSVVSPSTLVGRLPADEESSPEPDDGSGKTTMFDLQSANRTTFFPSEASHRASMTRLSFQADAVTQFVAAIDYIINQKTFVSISVVVPSLCAYVSRNTFCLPPEVHEAVVDVMTEVRQRGYTISTANSIADDVEGTVFILLTEDLDTEPFPSGATVFVPSWLQLSVINARSCTDGKCVFMSPVPYSDAFAPGGVASEGSTDVMAGCPARFRDGIDTDSLWTTSGSDALTYTHDAGENPILYYPLFLGYVDGVIFMQAMRQSLLAEMAWGQIYSLGSDWQVGPFSEACAADDTAAGDSLLECGMTNGVHTVYFLNVSSEAASLATQLQAHSFSFPLFQRVALPIDLSKSQLKVLVQPEDLPPPTADFSELSVHAVASLDSASRSNVFDADTYVVSMGVPVSADVVAAAKNSLFVDPVLDEPLSSENCLYLSPTAEEEIVVLGQVIESCYSGLPITIVAAGPANVSAYLDQAGVTGEMETRTWDQCRSQQLQSHKNTVYLLVGNSGLTADAAFDCLQLLSADQEAQIMLTMDILTKTYSLFSNVEAWPIHDSQRVYFATNLETWAGDRSTTELGRRFREAYALENRTPSSMHAFTALTFLSSLTKSFDVAPVPLQLLDAVDGGDGVLDQFSVGPSVVVENLENTSTQAWNSVSQSLTVWERSGVLSFEPPTGLRKMTSPLVYVPLGTVFDENDDSGATVPSDTTSTTLAPLPTESVTRPAEGNGLSKGAIAGIVVVACIVVIAAIALLLFFCCVYAGNTRNNSNAPKDNTKPVAMAFTDIESSTALWSSVPSVMSTAVADHHKIIRRLIVKYKCYEVKTIGDSFMIAADHPFRLVQLSRDLQLQLQTHNWGTSVISDVYAALAKDKDKNRDGPPASPQSFNGLRVRVGIHVGMANIEFDDVTKGYDYYGDTINTAARTESLASGGQTIMTEHVHAALDETEKNSITVCSLGPQHLRGVPEPINMLELVVLPERLFDVIETTPIVSAQGDAALLQAEENLESMLCHDTMSESSAKKTKDVLGVHFAPYSTSAQIKMLKKSLKKFGIVPPKRSHFPDDDTYVAQLLALAVQRTTDIVEFRKQPACEALQAYSEWTAPARQHVVNPLDTDDMPDCVAVRVRETEPDQDGAEQCSASPAPEVRRGRPASHASSVVFTELELEDGSDADMAQPLPTPDALRERYGFKNGVPEVRFDEVVKCFDVSGDGMLYRLFCTSANRWAFYNDTPDLLMTVKCILGRRSRISALGKTIITFDESTRRSTCELVIAPLSTELFVEGKMNGYKFQYSAVEI